MNVEERLSLSAAKLLCYAKAHLGLSGLDAIYKENLLLRELGLDSPYEGEIDEKEIKSLSVPDPLVDPLIEALVDSGKEEGEAERIAAYCLGLLSPSPNEVAAFCLDKIKEGHPKQATDFLYSLSIRNQYIAKTRVDRNIVFPFDFREGSPLEISINLSKPEKDNKAIAKLLTFKSKGYPKCLLCKENIGYKGNPKHPARGNIRYIPLSLDGEDYFLQYSPYVYYPEHCIVFASSHYPMGMGEHIFRCLLDFVTLFPHYFLGSNADLPIVGGSILDHEHFQGGAHLLPLLKAKARKTYLEGEVALEQADFYDTALILRGKSKEKVAKLASAIFEAWRGYADEDNLIVPFEGETRHNTVTPIARIVDGEYRLFLILRNNRYDDKYPDGIFHAHPESHHVKKEGIGLIEAAGYFVLPGRLKRQTEEAKDAVAKGLNDAQAISLYPDLSGFEPLLKHLRQGQSVESYLALVCRRILSDVAVFKDNEKGQKGLDAFIAKALEGYRQ